LPELLAVVLALAGPLNVSVDPLPPAVGLIVPEMLKVWKAVAVKFSPVTLAPLRVMLWTMGLNVKPVRLGVTAYVPFANPLKVKLPELLAVVVALAAPLKVTVVPLPPVAGLIVPDMLNVWGGGWVLCPLTTPAQPQRRAIGTRIPTSKSAPRARELMFCECGASFRARFIVQAPQKSAWT